jgi:hypothetical protein
MNMGNDNSPVENTCPMIDEVIEAIKIADFGNSNYDTHYLEKTMNKIRFANGELRDWGNNQYIECNDLAVKVEKLESQLSELEKENKDLKESEKFLCLEISELRAQLNLD